jgi:hypothetical protein
MAVLEKEHALAVDGNAAWAVLADFGNFLTWATGGVGTARIEGEGVGMIRHLNIPGVGEMAERMDRCDTQSQCLVYTLLYGNPAGMGVYRATVQIVANGEGACTLKWHGEFEPMEGQSEQEVVIALGGSYDAMAQGLETYVKQR